MDLSQFEWINTPNDFEVSEDRLTIQTDEQTDFWQRTHYGFRNDNAHAFVRRIPEVEFSFSVHTRFKPAAMYDQCGVVIYQDSENWFKGSIEYDNPAYSRLGSVVTNGGFSDWATTDIRAGEEIRMRYRLSRRGMDFLLENAMDGNEFRQMRIFHLGAARGAVRAGVYACSPLRSSINAVFTGFALTPCMWPAYNGH